MNQKNNTDRTVEDLVEKQERLRQKSLVKDTQINKFKAVTWACVVIGFIVAIAPLFSSNELGFNGYGDFVGGTVAAIWSLGGIFLIYVAFLGQQQQLMNQQIELIQNQIEVRATQKELEGQKIEMEAQNRHFAAQRFETTFFNLLSNFNNLVSQIDFHESRMVDAYGILHTEEVNSQNFVSLGDNPTIVIHKGKDAFKFMLDFFRSVYYESKLDESKMGDEKKTKFCFNTVLNRYEADLNHYFKNLLAIVKFVDTSIIQNKRFYISIIEAQISPNEWSLIFYYTLFKYDDDWTELALKYSLMENVETGLLIHGAHFEYLSIGWEEE